VEDIQSEWNDYQLDLILKYGMPKLGRWVYCKYCYKNVRPQLDFNNGIVKCSKCGDGLAPLDEVIKAGSYKKREEKIGLDFNRMVRYLDKVRESAKQPDGMDEYGEVPGICPSCKKRQATIYTSKGNFCTNCAPPGL
jgi:hypothetical protein